MRYFIPTLILASFVCLAAYAAPVNMSKSLSSGAIEIEADDGIEWRQNDKAYIAQGNVIANYGTMKVHSDKLSAFYRQKEGQDPTIFRLEADGNVKLKTQTETAYGDKAVYDVDQAVMILVGKNLKLEMGKEYITAQDSLEYWDTKRMAIARGNAVVTQNNKKMKANTLTAKFVADKSGNLELSRMEALGNVVITTGNEIAQGQKGTYDVKSGIATLSGDVKITRGDTQLNGAKAEVNLKTGVSRLLGSDNGKKTRVKGLFKPQKE